MKRAFATAMALGAILGPLCMASLSHATVHARGEARVHHDAHHHASHCRECDVQGDAFPEPEAQGCVRHCFAQAKSVSVVTGIPMHGFAPVVHAPPYALSAVSDTTGHALFSPVSSPPLSPSQVKTIVLLL